MGIVIDNFAGGGGASTAMEQALGRHVDIAINHDEDAIRMHKANHPNTEHYCDSVWEVDPREACKGRPVDVAWFSPDCFPAGTLVLTSTGYDPIETINEGDLVLTHNGRWRSVTATMKTRRKTRVIKGAGHPGLEVSDEHPFYISETKNVWNNKRRRYERKLLSPQWIKAGDLKTQKTPNNKAGGGDHFWASPSQFGRLDIPEVSGRGMVMDENLLWLAGLYVGDGWSRLGKGRAELVITYNQDHVDGLLSEITKRFPKPKSKAIYNQLNWNNRLTKTAAQLSTNHKGLVEWLRDNFGHLSHVKKLPAWLLGAKKSLRSAFLEGYKLTDVYKSKANRLESSTVSKALAFSLRSLVESMGFDGCVYGPLENKNVIQGRTVNTKPTWRVIWTEANQRPQTIRRPKHSWGRVKSNKPNGDELRDLYNISVSDDETYVVEGVVVHNCKHFSRAAGGTPKDQTIRGLAWVVLKWAALPEWQRPRIIFLENVSEFLSWCPVTKKGEIDKRYTKGTTFRRWVGRLKKAGYTVGWKELKADAYGAPTIRKRLFLVARCDGLPIKFPMPTHGDPRKDPLGITGLKPWRTASEIIDWSVPCKSIFKRDRPLADNTMKRIAAGLKKFVIDNPEPFIVKVNHGYDYFRGQSLHQPLQTITSKLGSALVTPVVDAQYGQSTGRSVEEPLGSVTAGGQGKQALIAPIIDRQFGNATGDTDQNDIQRPLGSVTAGGGGGKSALVTPEIKEVDATPYIEEFYTNSSGHSVEKPLNTVLSKEKHGVVAPIIQHVAHSKAKNGCMPADEPMRTITATPKGGSLALTTAFMAQHNTGVVGRDADAPLSTITHRGTQQQPVTIELEENIDDHSEAVTAFLMKYYGNEKSGCDIKEPLHTVTTKDRFGLIVVRGKEYRIVDIGMRMLTPRELFNAQGFPEDYDILEGNMTKTSQVAKAGNAVSPPPAIALIKENAYPYMNKDEILEAAE